MFFMLVGCSVFGGKAAEEPSHRVILVDGDIQVREYGTYVVAQTVVNDAYRTATNEGFRRLFAYLSGANRGSSRIDMTAPVLVSPRAPEAMLAFDSGVDGWTTAFILPEGASAATAPQPQDVRVMLRDAPARRVAAIRFPGFLRSASAENRRRELAAWLQARGLHNAGDWRMAGYHPPWTLPPLRRNEVIVTLKDERSPQAPGKPTVD